MIFRNKIAQMLLPIALFATGACSRGAGSTGNGGGAVAQADPSTPPLALNINCATIFTPADVAGILPQAATVGPLPGRSTACLFRSADSSQIQVSWDDDMERALWLDPNQRAMGHYVPVTGLGEEAFAQLSEAGGQLYIRKGGHYCGIVAGLPQPKVTGDALTRQLGALCDKVFAAAS